MDDNWDPPIGNLAGQEDEYDPRKLDFDETYSWTLLSSVPNFIIDFFEMVWNIIIYTFLVVICFLVVRKLIWQSSMLYSWLKTVWNIVNVQYNDDTITSRGITSIHFDVPRNSIVTFLDTPAGIMGFQAMDIPSSKQGRQGKSWSLDRQERPLIQNEYRRHPSNNNQNHPFSQTPTSFVTLYPPPAHRITNSKEYHGHIGHGEVPSRYRDLDLRSTPTPGISNPKLLSSPLISSQFVDSLWSIPNMQPIQSRDCFLRPQPSFQSNIKSRKATDTYGLHKNSFKARPEIILQQTPSPKPNQEPFMNLNFGNTHPSSSSMFFHRRTNFYGTDK